MRPEQCRPGSGCTFYNKNHVINIPVIVIIDVQIIRHCCLDVFDGSFQQAVFSVSSLAFLVSLRIGSWIVRHVIRTRINILVRNNGRKHRNRVEKGRDRQFVVGSKPEIIQHRTILWFGVVEHVGVGCCILGVFGLVAETDVHHQVIECADVAGASRSSKTWYCRSDWHLGLEKITPEFLYFFW